MMQRISKYDPLGDIDAEMSRALRRASRLNTDSEKKMGQSDEHNRFFKENVAADSSTSFLLSRLS
jgi:hypothetical protein